MERRVNAKVHGLVQGVGFRMFVVREAAALKLTGWARNLPDGTVEIEAQGKPDVVETLLRKVRQGPSRSRVTGVNIREASMEADTEGFRIRQ
jgi:acylphosphatase